MAQEFLPLCDVLFNIISLAAYFCDVVFDLVTIYTLYTKGEVIWFAVALSFVLGSLLASQLLSLRWCWRHSEKAQWNVAVLITAHCLQSGVLWRYFKLFIPVDLQHVKQEVRDLCVLRMTHAFCESAPMLMIQLYLIWCNPLVSDVTQLNVVSTMLSLFSVCWALASFNKHVRRRNMHKLVLTWLGVVSQFFWRLGTISSRVVVLTVYATLYHYWTFLVIGLHWLSMFLWLISPKNVFHGETMQWRHRCTYSSLIAFVYTFCYVNLQESNSRHKMVAFYVTMFLENSLLMAVWLGQRATSTWFEIPAVVVVWGGFAIGVLFMLLYYRLFHIRRMKYSSSWTSTPGIPQSSCLACQSACGAGGEPGVCVEHAIVANSNSEYFHNSEMSAPTSDTATTTTNSHSANKLAASGTFGNMNGGGGLHGGHMMGNGGLNVAYVPGVFNCRLNPALMKRKKKKPTSFIPPPATHGIVIPMNSEKMDQPFWKRTISKAVPVLPVVVNIPKSLSSDQEGSVGSRVNIQQKLQEKKQQQLQELKEIEEEIKQGKIQRPPGEQGSIPHHQPIPRAKKQPWVKPDPPPIQVGQYDRGPQEFGQVRHRSKTPEILLAPHYLERQPDERWMCSGHHPPFHLDGSGRNKISRKERGDYISSNHRPRSRKSDHHHYHHAQQMYKSYRIPSDLDSQVSLPRSYTLPREFRYYRKPRARKTVRSEHFVTSTNSSDGDVDSCGDEGNDICGCVGDPISNFHHHYEHPVNYPHHLHPPFNSLAYPSYNCTYVGYRSPSASRRHETKL